MQPILLTPSGELPNGLTPERCDALGLTPIMPSVQPAPAPGMQIVEAEPELVDGVHHQRWASVPVTPPEPVDPKLAGIAFEGVLCSATSQDQAGLMAVLLAVQLQGAAFKPTRFIFENGSELVLHRGNFQAFVGKWMPFRQGFFAP